MPLVAEAVRHGTPLLPREVEDGDRVFRLSLTRVRGGGGESSDVLLVAEDVTEQRRVFRAPHVGHVLIVTRDLPRFMVGPVPEVPARFPSATREA